MSNLITTHTTDTGRHIYEWPLAVFDKLIANVFLIDHGGSFTLVDCGSGLAQSNQDLLAGFDALQSELGLNITLADVDHILVTHGHIDHFGGLPFVRQHNQKAAIHVHMLDQRVVTNHEERVVVAASHLQTFLRRSGVADEQLASLMNGYLWAKSFYRSVPVQHFLSEETPFLDEMPVYHVPGHSPGLVCVKVDDLLLVADHILSKTTPHQAPESITRNMGLTHYFASLDKVAAIEGVRCGLGAHEALIEDIPARVAAIRRMHNRRLDRVITACGEPSSIVEISRKLFGEVRGYHVLLALEEAGAHVEYLYERGLLSVDNIDAISADSDAVIRYVTT